MVLPLQADANALVATVGLLAERWPADVDAELLVPTGPLSARDRAVLGALEGDVQLLEVPGTPTYGALCRAAAQAAAGADRLLLLAEDACPTADALAAGEGLVAPQLVRSAAVLDTAVDLRSVRALLAALTPAPAPRLPVPPALPPAPREAGLLSVVVATRDRRALRGCLDALARCTRRPYEVVVVDATGSTAAAAPDRGVRLVPAPAGTSYDAALDLGIAASRGQWVALLDPATVVTRFWAEALLRPLEQDAAVAGVAARATSAPGLLAARGVTYRGSAQFARAADAWRREARGQVRELELLGGPLVVLRAAALERSGLLPDGFSRPDWALAALSARLRADGGRLVAADEVLVHAEDRARWPAPACADEAGALRELLRAAGSPLLSATLIVKDEQRSLAVCLASAAGLVDEVVVSDTGSTDRTVEVAEAMGARVVHRPWSSDFAAARNHAHAAARGLWALVLDADEQLVLDPAEHDRLVDLLLRVPDDGVGTPLRHLSETEDRPDIEHMTVRFLRRAALVWRGVVHETPVRLTGEPSRVCGAEWLRVEHDGYRAEVFTDKDKSGRNLQLAHANYERNLVEDGGRWAWKGAYELARALLGAPETAARAEGLLREALATMPERTHFRADALVRLSEVLLRDGRPQEAEEPARAARALQADGRPVLALALALVAQGRREEALAVVAAFVPPVGGGHGEMRDVLCEQVTLPALHGSLLLELGRPADAAEVLQCSLVAAPTSYAAWQPLADALRAADPTGWAEQLGRWAAHAPQPALAALRDLSGADREGLERGLRAAGVEPGDHAPEAVYARQVADAVRGHSPAAVAAAAADLEPTDPAGALELWRRLPASAAVQVARARCLFAQERLEEAVEALDGLDVGELDAPDLLTVAALAATAGDVATAGQVLQSLPPVEAPLAREALSLATLLGPGVLDALPQHVRALA